MSWTASPATSSVTATTMLAPDRPVAAIAFVPIAGFLTSGTNAVLPKGEAVNGLIDEDVQLSFAATKPEPEPMQVPVVAQGTAVAAASRP